MRRGPSSRTPEQTAGDDVFFIATGSATARYPGEFAHEFDRSPRTIPRQPFAVLSLDVDGLKATNDAHGHAAWDALLRMVGDTHSDSSCAVGT